MVFGDARGPWGAPAAEARRIIDAYAEAGGNFIDTASNYAAGESERIVGEATREARDRWVIATKYTLTRRADDPNAGGNHRKSLVQSLELSLRALGTSYVDVLWVHAPDRFTPMEETLRVLDDQVRAGKVLYVGISDFPAWQVARAATIADLRGWTRFVGLQIPYSLVERTVERELLPMARALELAVTTWAPLGGGLLTGRYGTQTAAPREGTRLAGIGGRFESHALSPRNLQIADVVNQIAGARGVSATQVALAWVRSQSARAVLVPIVGARTQAQLATNLGALTFELDESERRRLDDVSAIEPGFPHDFDVDRLVYGSTKASIDDHRGGIP